MKLRLLSFLAIILLDLTATAAHAGCTLRDRQSLLDSGMSSYEIDKTCGEIKDTVRSTEPELVRPKMPDTHGRLQETSNICQSNAIWCELGQAAPPGAPCQCNTRYGPVAGVVVRK